MSVYDLSTCRVLTVRPPWSHAIAWLGKDPENRSWAPKPWGDGTNTLLIHAGLRYDYAATAARLGVATVPHDVVYGAVVAVVNVPRICRWELDHPTRPGTCECRGRWSEPGQAHWRLTDVFRLPKPVPMTGGQGLRRPAARVIAAVAGQLPDNPEPFA